METWFVNGLMFRKVYRKTMILTVKLVGMSSFNFPFNSRNQALGVSKFVFPAIFQLLKVESHIDW